MGAGVSVGVGVGVSGSVSVSVGVGVGVSGSAGVGSRCHAFQRASGPLGTPTVREGVAPPLHSLARAFIGALTRSSGGISAVVVGATGASSWTVGSGRGAGGGGLRAGPMAAST